jgi:hypothetical protein
MQKQSVTIELVYAKARLLVHIHAKFTIPNDR